MTKVRMCPGCSDRVSDGDAFCERCGRPLPGGARRVPEENPDTVPTGPNPAVPGLVAEDGGPTAPQVSLYGVERYEGRGAKPPEAARSEPSPERSAAPGPARRGEPGTGKAHRTAGPDDATVTGVIPPGVARPKAPAREAPVPGAPTAEAPRESGRTDRCVWCPGRVVNGYCEQCGSLQPTGRDHVEVRAGTAAGVSDRGLRHRRNEDAMAVRVVPDDSPYAAGAVCAVVCDGVSTSPRSDEASRITAETGATVLAERLRRGADAREATGVAMTRAAEAVAAIADSPSSAPACTFVSAVVDPATGTVTVGWVGDSRAYWLSGGPASSGSALLTRDDSWSEAMVQMGALSREEAMRSANAHALIAWMGADSGEIDAHISTITPSGPGAVLLCSDGLWNYYPEARALADAVPGAGERPLEAARTYVRLALEGGGKDNITVVVIPVPAGGSRAGRS